MVEGARRLRSIFEDLNLDSFVKTTGGKGVHVVVPVTDRVVDMRVPLRGALRAADISRDEPALAEIIRN